MIFTLGALALPGTTGIIGEFIILMGAFKKSILVATLASLGVILAAAYMLWLYKRVVFGKIKNKKLNNIMDLNKTEILIFTTLAFLTIFFGFYPDPLLNTVKVSVANLIENYNHNLTIYLSNLNQ